MNALKVPEGSTPPAAVVKRATEFLESFATLEGSSKVPLLLYHDLRSDGYYLMCHVDSKQLATKCDDEAVLDPLESEDYRFNREVTTDTSAYKSMLSDAKLRRSFEDIVVEYDTSYHADVPLKIFGGQHRAKAVREALAAKSMAMHGIRVYFSLTKEQKADIARANNTAIAVANDLLDRMQEDLMGPELRTWGQAVGLLGPNETFADRRNSEGVPTVRIARTLIVDFFEGKKGSQADFHELSVCDSGNEGDSKYAELRNEINWTDPALIKMGSEFVRLHKAQRATVLGRDKDKYQEFANKALHPCVAGSWAYAAGLLQGDSKALEKHYGLPSSVEAPDDPLDAAELLKAKLKGVDKDTYRGLGARISAGELGRMLELFILQARVSSRPGITLKLANLAIKEFEWKRQKRDADKARENL